MLIWSANNVILFNSAADQETMLAITGTKHYVPVVTLQLPVVSIQTQNKYLDCLIGPSFHRVSVLFVASFENNAHQASHKRYLPATRKMKDYNIMIDG